MAVVVVAAYFTSLQRAAVRQAVEATGLAVVQLLSEPVAAAMAYGLFVAGKKQVSTTRGFGGLHCHPRVHATNAVHDCVVRCR